MRTRSLLGLLLLIPLVDAFVLVAIVSWGVLTALETVALVVLTGLVGMLLVRAEGRNTLGRFQRKAASGSVPTDELVDGGLLIAAGAFCSRRGWLPTSSGCCWWYRRRDTRSGSRSSGG